MSPVSYRVLTNDGIRLNVLEAGQGRPLVLVHGWSQTAAQFRHQLTGLSDRYRTVAIDLRGHGDSDKPEHGYRVPRLAKDLHDALEVLGIENAAIVGHGMGCSVLWCYVDLFGLEHIERLVFVDQAPAMVPLQHWTIAEIERFGAILPARTVTQITGELLGPDGERLSRALVGGWVTEHAPDDLVEWIAQQNLKLPRRHAATLLRDHCSQDWRDVIPRLLAPCLFVSGRQGAAPWQSVAWCAQQVEGARFELFEEDEGGQHFPFEENPERFNRMLAEFVR